MAHPSYYFVYGNHGPAPAQLEDYFHLIRDAIRYSTGQSLKVSQLPVPGAWNVIVENFDENFSFMLTGARKANPDTRIICLVTEFMTKRTFNDFDANAKSDTTQVQSKGIALSESLSDGVHRYLQILFARPIRSLVSRAMPWLYYPAKAVYLRMVNRSAVMDVSAHYAAKDYWKNRHRYFEQLLPQFDGVWYVAESQRAGYEKIVDPAKLWHLPIIPYSDSPPAATERDLDIDFLFTGTVTPYRSKLLRALERANKSVFTGPSNLPEHIRQDYLNRAKICVHLKPSQAWRYSSNMRLHSLLMSGKVVIAERSEEPVVQDQFVHLVSSERFVDYCLEQITKSDFDRAGNEARQGYLSATRETRIRVGNHLRMILGIKPDPLQSNMKNSNIEWKEANR